MTTASPSALEQILQRAHLPALDGIRAISVMLVILYHFGVGVPAGLGVSAFFVLSGFLITWLLLREYAKTADISLRGFYLRRSLRIFPAYFVFIAMAVGAELALGYELWPTADLIAAFTYTVNYLNAFNGHTSQIAHAWSLAVEEQFYLLWPVMFIAFRRRSVGTLGMVTAGTIAAVVAWRSYLYLGRDVGSAYIYNAFDTRFDNLLVGCLLAIVVTADAGRRALGRLASRPWAPIPTAVLLWLSNYASSSYHYSIGFTVDAVLIAALIIQLLTWSETSGWRWLNGRVATTLGVLSYPMYLYHMHGLNLAQKFDMPRGIQFLVGTFVTIGVAWASHRVVEMPFLRLKGRVQHAPRPSRELIPEVPTATSQA